MQSYQPIIGLEVHIELATKSKMFCGCPADHFGKPPNTQTCPVCLGLPGALPVPNKKAVEWTILLGLALGCKVNEESKFDRKNYFYPDLPKGYQISQYDQPIAHSGELKFKIQNSKFKMVRIRRVHLEEDTGKLQHEGDLTLVDFNRSGVPLVEIVTEPDFRTIDEVDVYLKKLQRLIRYLGISSADMEKGSMRIEPSVSIAPILNLKFEISNLPDYRVELKNINSFRFARRAIEYEIKRQTEILEGGGKVTQQTRGWDETKSETLPQREKEEAHDYRYFPEPDIPPMRISNEQLSIINKQIPELPDIKLARFVKQYGISDYMANILIETIESANKFEELVKKEKDFTPVDIANSLINNRPLVAKTTGIVSDEIIEKVLFENPKAVADYQSGKTAVLGFLMGCVVKLNPNLDKRQIQAKLESRLNNA